MRTLLLLALAACEGPTPDPGAPVVCDTDCINSDCDTDCDDLLDPDTTPDVDTEPDTDDPGPVVLTLSQCSGEPAARVAPPELPETTVDDHGWPLDSQDNCVYPLEEAARARWSVQLRAAMDGGCANHRIVQCPLDGGVPFAWSEESDIGGLVTFYDAAGDVFSTRRTSDEVDVEATACVDGGHIRWDGPPVHCPNGGPSSGEFMSPTCLGDWEFANGGPTVPRGLLTDATTWADTCDAQRSQCLTISRCSVDGRALESLAHVRTEVLDGSIDRIGGAVDWFDATTGELVGTLDARTQTAYGITAVGCLEREQTPTIGCRLDP